MDWVLVLKLNKAESTHEFKSGLTYYSNPSALYKNPLFVTFTSKCEAFASLPRESHSVSVFL